MGSLQQVCDRADASQFTRSPQTAAHGRRPNTAQVAPATPCQRACAILNELRSAVGHREVLEVYIPHRRAAWGRRRGVLSQQVPHFA